MTDARPKRAEGRLRAVPAAQTLEVCLLGTFDVRRAGDAAGPVPVASQRLIAYLALHERAVARTAIAAALWPDVSESRAGDSLRSALTRLDAVARSTVTASASGLRLAADVAVDVRDARALAHRLLNPGPPLPKADLSPAAVSMLSRDLLPDWYDDWVRVEAESWRQLRVSALEAQARLLMDAGLLAWAAEAAHAAINVEPLRETAHALLIRVHLAGGNQSEALRVYDRYRALLHAELGLAPTALIDDLVRDLHDVR